MVIVALYQRSIQGFEVHNKKKAKTLFYSKINPTPHSYK